MARALVVRIARELASDPANKGLLAELKGALRAEEMACKEFERFYRAAAGDVKKE